MRIKIFVVVGLLVLAMSFSACTPPGYSASALYATLAFHSRAGVHRYAVYNGEEYFFVDGGGRSGAGLYRTKDGSAAELLTADFDFRTVWIWQEMDANLSSLYKTYRGEDVLEVSLDTGRTRASAEGLRIYRFWLEGDGLLVVAAKKEKDAGEEETKAHCYRYPG
jgi:hypothetical protein